MDRRMVSVIIVCRNEQKYIVQCLESILQQFDKNEPMELIVVDGLSEDDTLTLVKNFGNRNNIDIKIIINPGKTLAKGWNLGIKEARGEYIIRPDAHATLGKDYIRTAKSILQKQPGTAAVGGKLITASNTFTGYVISEALSMRTGVGNSSFRTSKGSGYSDTVVYALYRKHVFDDAGYFNEELVRHQDTEFHARIREKGYLLFMHGDISATYYCRDNIKAILRQMYEIGFYFSGLAKLRVFSSLRPRHLIPFVFYCFLFVLLFAGIFYTILHKFLLIAILIYIGTIVVESITRLWRHGNPGVLFTILLVPMMHFSYAFGTFIGIIKYMSGR